MYFPRISRATKCNHWQKRTEWASITRIRYNHTQFLAQSTWNINFPSNLIQQLPLEKKPAEQLTQRARAPSITKPCVDTTVANPKARTLSLSLSLSLFGSRDRAQLAVLLATKTISLHGEWSIAILLSSLVNKTATLSRNFLFQRRVDGARIGNSWENTSSVDYDFDLFVRSLFTVRLFGFFFISRRALLKEYYCVEG